MSSAMQPEHVDSSCECIVDPEYRSCGVLSTEMHLGPRQVCPCCGGVWHKRTRWNGRDSVHSWTPSTKCAHDPGRPCPARIARLLINEEREASP